MRPIHGLWALRAVERLCTPRVVQRNASYLMCRSLVNVGFHVCDLSHPNGHLNFGTWSYKNVGRRIHECLRYPQGPQKDVCKVLEVAASSPSGLDNADPFLISSPISRGTFV